MKGKLVVSRIMVSLCTHFLEVMPIYIHLILYIKRDLPGNTHGKDLEECGIVNYSLCNGGIY
ncbi:MAG: hypothetical protein ACTSPC_00850 [Candidatus Heimdallarchaeota archaeon]